MKVDQVVDKREVNTRTEWTRKEESRLGSAYNGRKETACKDDEEREIPAGRGFT